MDPWEREQADHVFDNTVERVGPIIRSRAIETAPDLEVAGGLGDVDAVQCPTCGQALPGVATACPDDGTTFA